LLKHWRSLRPWWHHPERGVLASVRGSGLDLAAAAQPDLDRGLTLGEQALTQQRTTRNCPDTVYALLFLRGTRQAARNHARAMACFREALALDWEQGDKRGLLECLTGIVASATTVGEFTLAARLLRALESLREAIATPIPPRLRPVHEGAVAAARAALGDGVFSAEWKAGQALSLGEVVAEALGAGQPAARE
jgi:hypothetical protein